MLAPDITQDLGRARPFPEVGVAWQELEPGSRDDSGVLWKRSKGAWDIKTSRRGMFSVLLPSIPESTRGP